MVKAIFGSIKERFLDGCRWYSVWRSAPVSDWIKASTLYRAGDFSGAINLYERGLKRYPKNSARINAMLDVSHCLFRVRRFKESEAYLRRLLVEMPDLREPYIRLARLQMWLGYGAEAISTARVAVLKFGADPELATIFINAVLDAGASREHVLEARSVVNQFSCDGAGFPRFDVACVRLSLADSGSIEARDRLSQLASLDKGPFDAVVAFAEVLLAEGKVNYAKHHLRRALSVAPEHPTVLRLLARTYLQQTDIFNPTYARQLATSACQSTGWLSIRDLVTLAQSYIACGEQVEALLTALKAKELSARFACVVPEAARIEELLQQGSFENQA